jgi:hypothetical protein
LYATHVGLDQTAGEENIIALVARRERLQTPNRTRRQEDVLGVRAIDVKAHFVQAFAMIRLTVRAGTTTGAPQHFFRCDALATFERFVRAFVERVLAGFHHDAGKFVTQNARKAGQPRIKNVAIFGCLRHVNIGAADAARFDLQQHLVGSRRRNIVLSNLQSGISPDQTAQIRLAPLDIFCAQFETGLGLPIRNECYTLHFTSHCSSSDKLEPRTH